MKNVRFNVVRVDGLPGYGAYLSGSLSREKPIQMEFEPGCGVILLSVEAAFDDSAYVYEDGSPADPPEDRKRHLIETLMHEFGHAMEEHYRVEHDEDWIQKAVESWNPKN